jgi:hypothetical protein
MDDFQLTTLNDTRSEYSAILISKITPCIVQGIFSIYKEAVKLCEENDENEKYLMTFQNFLGRVTKWSSEIIDKETERIVNTCGCSYLEDLLTCVHVTQLKILTTIRVGQKQKKIDIDIPKLNRFIHSVYIDVARRIYKNVYLFEKNILPLQKQKNLREIELLVKESILHCIRESMPIETILRSYLDETIEDDVEQVKEDVEEVVEKIEESNENQQGGNQSNNDSNTRNNDSTTTKKVDTDAIETNHIEDSIKNETEDTTNQIIAKQSHPHQTINFNNNDQIQQYVKNASASSINSIPPETNIVVKSVDNLEKISEANYQRRKLEEEQDYETDSDDDDYEQPKIKIMNDTNVKLDTLDVHSLDEPITLNTDSILGDIEVLA